MMKRTRFIVRLLLAALLAAMLAGCGGTQTAPEPAPAAPERTAPEPSAAQEPPATPETDAERNDREAATAYEAVLDQICDVLYNGVRDDEDYPYVGTGVMEAAMYLERDELLRRVGYMLDDISGDGVPELLVGALPDGGESGDIYAGFTCKDGEPVCFLDGWARNRHLWLGGGRFYNFGSGGAANSAFGTFRISPDGTELQCEDFYFTEPKGEDYSDVGYYHNTTGVWEKSAAEELDVAPEAFWELSERCEAESLTPDLTPFADRAYTGYVAQPLSCKVRVDYLDDAAYKYSHYDDASAYFSSGEAFDTTVLFQPDEDVRDFTLLALTLKDVEADGEAVFDVATVFRVPSLRAGVPLAVPMSFPGDVPSNGFSYTDADGTVKTYTIGVSGRDGSLEVAPLER